MKCRRRSRRPKMSISFRGREDPGELFVLKKPVAYTLQNQHSRWVASEDHLDWSILHALPILKCQLCKYLALFYFKLLYKCVLFACCSLPPEHCRHHHQNVNSVVMCLTNVPEKDQQQAPSFFPEQDHHLQCRNYRSTLTDL